MKITNITFLEEKKRSIVPVPAGQRKEVEGVFLKNSKETNMPDIDFDVSNPMELKELLIDDWGANTVVPISNFNKLQLRSLIKDIAKLYDIPFAEANSVTSKMIAEATPIAKKKHGIKAGVYAPTFEEVMEYSDSLKNFLRKYPKIKTHVEALVGEVRSVSRHAGGVVIGEDLDKHMPLINSGGVTQTPWSEGQHVRQLEPMGFIKFDILGLSTLKMIEGAITHILRRHHGIDNPTFEQVKEYYDEKLHPERINLNDKKVYENIFWKGKWAGIFQFAEKGAQYFCQRTKPKNIIDVAAITAVYRPGPLSANVHETFMKAKENPGGVSYGHDIVKEITKETYGFLIFQEQIALLAHKLGKDLSLDEGNKLRKLLTKKGTGAAAKQKTKLKVKFTAGCAEKGLSEEWADKMWQKFEFFSGYGFNKCLSFSEQVSIYNSDGKRVADKQIKDVQVGDIVRSRDEQTGKDIFIPVKENHHSGKKKVFRFEFDDGREVKCTMDHKFRTKCGKMLAISEILKRELEIV